MNENKPIRVALVHDYLIRWGGAERVLFALHKLFPSAPVYTLFADPAVYKDYFEDTIVRTSYLQRLPRFFLGHHQFLAPFCIAAVEQFDLANYDIVISSSSSFAKGVITRPETIHIWYCHTPTRFLWDWTHQYAEHNLRSFAAKTVGRLGLHVFRLWDFHAAQRPDYIITNSQAVRTRIQKFYRRDAAVIYPPTSVLGRTGETRGNPAPQGDYFLIVSYLQKYKNVGVAVDAFSKLGLPLVVIGDGPQMKELRARAGSSVKFIGWQSDDVIGTYLHSCKAFIFPSDDDFGIAPVEAMLHGKPVLALRRGGVQESVVEGVTGEFFDEPHPAVLADGVRRMAEKFEQYDSERIRKHAEKFSSERFGQEIREYIRHVLAERWE